MEVEEAMEDTNPQQASVEYGDNGELELNFGGGLLEAEQELEASPHYAPAAYEESPPPRLVAKATIISKVASRHLPWSQPKPAAEDTYKTSRRVLPAFNKPTSLPILCIVLTCHHMSAAVSGKVARPPSSVSNSSSVQPQPHAEYLCVLQEYRTHQCSCWHVFAQLATVNT